MNECRGGGSARPGQPAGRRGGVGGVRVSPSSTPAAHAHWLPLPRRAAPRLAPLPPAMMLLLVVPLLCVKCTAL